MPKNISRDEALKIVLRHLDAEAQKGYMRGIEIHDRVDVTRKALPDIDRYVVHCVGPLPAGSPDAPGIP